MAKTSAPDDPYASPACDGEGAREPSVALPLAMCALAWLQFFGAWTWLQGGLEFFVDSYSLDGPMFRLGEFLTLALLLTVVLDHVALPLYVSATQRKWLRAMTAVVIFSHVVAVGLWWLYATRMLPRVPPDAGREFVLYFTLMMIGLHVVRGTHAATFPMRRGIRPTSGCSQT